MDKDWILFEGVLFNIPINAKKTLQEFTDHENHHGLSKEKIQEVYSLITGKKVTEKTKAELNGVKDK